MWNFSPFHPYSVLFANRFESEAKNARFLFFFKIPRKLEFLRFHAKWTKNLWRMFIESVRDMFGSNLLNVKKRVKYFILRVVSSRKVFQHISIYFNNNNIIIIIFRKNDCSCKFDSYSWFFSNFTWTRDETN